MRQDSDSEFEGEADTFSEAIFSEDVQENDPVSALNTIDRIIANMHSTLRTNEHKLILVSQELHEQREVLHGTFVHNENEITDLKRKEQDHILKFAALKQNFDAQRGDYEEMAERFNVMLEFYERIQHNLVAVTAFLCCMFILFALLGCAKLVKLE
jgi:hypothetical protein